MVEAVDEVLEDLAAREVEDLVDLVDLVDLADAVQEVRVVVGDDNIALDIHMFILKNIVILETCRIKI